MNLRVFKVRENAKLPSRTHETDAGMDLFYCPGGSEFHWRVLKPGQTDLFETGLKIEVPAGYMLQIMNKSGIAAKRQLVTGACVVDSGYNGEIFVNLHNIGTKSAVVESNQKVAQAVLIPVVIPNLIEINEDNIYESETSRGDGSLGSTGDF